jgi:uncharacterized membrane protein
VIAGQAHEVGGASLVIRPNRSLPVAGILALFAVLSTLALTVGVGFTLAGAWMVLPFAGLEIVLVGALCCWFYRHLDDCELVVIEPHRVRVLRRRGTEVTHHEFPRPWVRLILEEAGAGAPPRLAIGAHGRLVPLADDLGPEARAAVAGELRRLLREAQPQAGA